MCVGITTAERVTLREGCNSVTVILGELGAKATSALVLEEVRVRFHAEILQLGARVLHAKQEETDRTQRGLHPIPGKAANLKGSLQIFGLGNIFTNISQSKEEKKKKKEERTHQT